MRMNSRVYKYCRTLVPVWLQWHIRESASYGSKSTVLGSFIIHEKQGRGVLGIGLNPGS
jgi:hypothetical protein